MKFRKSTVVRLDVLHLSFGLHGKCVRSHMDERSMLTAPY